MEEYGYKGDLADVSAKAQFLREKFKTANVKPPRNFKEWFVPNKKIAPQNRLFKSVLHSTWALMRLTIFLDVFNLNVWF